METSHWPQGIGVVRAATTGDNTREKKPKPEQNLNCPRCNSTNTKFCYYNNYSLTQPRYFCKTCRRYWTEGGTLRNVPVGGGSKRKQRPSSSKKLDLTTPPPKFPSQNPKMNLGNYNPHMFNTIPPHELVALPLPFALDQPNPNFSTTSSSSPHLSFLELLKTTGNFTSAGANPVLDSDPVLISHGFPMHEFKIPALSFPSDHGVVENNSGYGNLQDQTSSSRLMGYPFGESNKDGAVEQDDGGVQEESNIGSYWNNNSNNGGSW